MLQEGRTYTIITQDSPFGLSLLDLYDPLVVGVGLESNVSNYQKWIVTREESGGWILKNVANGKFLSVKGKPEAKAEVIVADSPTAWRIDPGVGDPDYYWILTKDSDLTVGLDRTRLVYPPPAILQNDTRQAWKFVAA